MMTEQILFGLLAFLAGVSALVVFARIVVRSRGRRVAGLYVFHDGKRLRMVDPINVLMSLEEHPKFRLDLDPKRALEDGDREAMAVLADAVTQAFGVPTFTSPRQPGLTTIEKVELLASFLDYADLQKKSTESVQTSPQSTAAT